MFYCQHCGAENRNNASFCNRCGKNLVHTPSGSDNFQVGNVPQRARVNPRDPGLNAEVEQLRKVLKSAIGSMHGKENAVNRLRDLRDMGHSKARQVLLWYSGYMMGNPRLQRLATS